MYDSKVAADHLKAAGQKRFAATKSSQQTGRVAKEHQHGVQALYYHAAQGSLTNPHELPAHNLQTPYTYTPAHLRLRMSTAGPALLECEPAVP